jgi:hypothetical protein
LQLLCTNNTKKKRLHSRMYAANTYTQARQKIHISPRITASKTYSILFLILHIVEGECTQGCRLSQVGKCKTRHKKKSALNSPFICCYQKHIKKISFIASWCGYNEKTKIENTFPRMRFQYQNQCTALVLVAASLLAKIIINKMHLHF